MDATTGTVLVVGAGPTGMMAALELARFGISVRLIEKKSKAETTSRAVGVQARTLELLHQRGMAEVLISRGNKAPGATSFGGGKKIFRLDFAHTDSTYHYILFVSQAETEAVLRDALASAGVAIERGVSMIALAQVEHGPAINAVLEHADGKLERFDCEYLIDAEGAHSIARTTLGLHFAGKALPEDYALGDLYVDADDIVDTDLQTFSSEHGFLGLFPMGKRRFRLIASNPISKPSADTAPSIGELQQLYDQRSHISAHFRDMSWSSWFRISSRMIDHMQVGMVFFGGDSSHVHSPSGAQGMNTGMQDMVNLCWKLAMVMQKHAKKEILGTYTEDRVPVIKNVLEKTEQLTKVIGTESDVFRSVYLHLAPWIVGTPLIQENSTEHMSQLANNYRKSPLSESHGVSGDLHAGDRVPDVAVVVLNREGSSQQDPHPATLLNLMDPSTFTLLYVNITDPQKTHAEIHDRIGAWHYLMRGHQITHAVNDEAGFKKLFGRSGAIYLVRPDGYVAYRGAESAIEKLAVYCDKWFVAQSLPAAQSNPDSKNQANPPPRPARADPALM